MKRNRTAYSVAWFEENPRVDGSQTDQGEVLDDGCHMTSASRALRSEGHVITVSSPSPLSGVSRGGTSLMSSQETLKNQRIEALKDLNKLLRLVTEQEKKYETRLSPHSNFYRRQIMVQQFLQSQLSSQPSQRRQNISRNLAQSFGRGRPTARNIVRWEKEWVPLRNIPERKEREDSNSWVYDGDLNDAMREFVRIQSDCKYCLG